MIIPVATEHGRATDNLFWITMGVIGFVFVITQVLLFWYSYKYQHSDSRKAYYYPHNNKLEVIWTMIPAIVMALLVFQGWKTWAQITSAAPADSEIIEVVGKQFNWMVRYPGKDGKLGVVKHTLINSVNEFGMDFNDKNSMDDFTPMEIHVPVGRPVLFKIRARDVLHSVYVPHFRLKMDAVPGMATKFWFVADKTTLQMQEETGNPNFKYELACAEICGRGHFAMRMMVVVEEEAEYQKWLANQKAFAETNPDEVTAAKANKMAITALPSELEQPAAASEEL
ncbi:MAG: cytochrome c oxidase subunit II [Sphingobacteriales bacterium]|nr:MAG: cytochrome c oxidase subunit II [Sphingobacteriales bacterium]